MKAFHAFIGGEVQGVGFRYSAAREARRLGLTGWVRNLPDGEVEVWAQGDSTALDEFLDWLREGPPEAFVESVKTKAAEPKSVYRDFFIAASG